jgi:hypothetical protein
MIDEYNTLEMFWAEVVNTTFVSHEQAMVKVKDVDAPRFFPSG